MTDTRLTYYKHALFVIESSSGTKIGTDPYDESIKAVLPDISADIVTVSHHHFDHENVGLFKGNPKVIDSTGDTNIGDITITGIPTFHDEEGGRLRGKNIVFKIKVDRIVFTHLGDLGHDLDQEQIERLKDTDILMIPVGGTYTINAATALELINKIKPKIAVPMHYKSGDTLLNVDTVDSITGRLDDFKLAGSSVSINKESLPSGTEIWIMESE